MIIQSLEKIIEPQYKLSINSHDPKNNSIIIKETQQDAKLRKVEINGFSSEKTYGFTLDVKVKNRVIFNCFNSGEPNINKVCDGIIFTEIENKDYIFFCELKSDRPQPISYLVQYQNSQLFVDYLINILNSFYLKGSKITPNYKYLLFCTDTKQDSKARITTQPARLEGVKMRRNEDNGFEIPIYTIRRQIPKNRNTTNISFDIKKILET
ncbi:hypothetical protein VB715_20295 [Crocosphaera sp. UHCC 0190]|uniref:hypothetical protein n=1 Tax=Crocosphaera sp. UHCC 0190 TaxID=3110246 RepID=UPI002B201AA9|nr:hypothetical protein [Crocosphaera sp. UHCC 0190]MEA5512118.1 hypothetical protein [Crocosphaera sp. UHCC 0190]